ncbi:MAG: 3-deoxy-7-phosphoheptulonate synthase, partial [Clostridia bacterium]|nr:3-deoxy-7-phosphoheptulonate synthase [Clostridia bacterium]
MIIVLKRGTAQRDIDNLTNFILNQGAITVNPVVGENITILGLVGDTSHVDDTRLEANPCVERIMHVAEPFKRANRMFHPGNSAVKVGDVTVGGERLTVMAGPCSVESAQQVTGIAQEVKKAGAHLLRGCSFKPRTSPDAF